MRTISDYRADIDGLRAMSILAVLVFHAFPSLLPGGFVGVDVFFVISGYLISGIVQRELAAGQFSLLGFYQRRIRRIFPALALVILASLAIGWVVLLPSEFVELGRQAVAGSLMVPNLLFWSQAGYFDVENTLKPLLHLWSLGVEEQFYLAWPLLLALLGLERGYLRLVCVLLLLSLLGSLILTWRDPVSAFYLPFFRAWELLLGAALAGMRPRLLSRRTLDVLALAGLISLLMAVTMISKDTAFPGFAALLPTLGALALIAAGPEAVLNRWLLSNPLMVFLGKISYPLYLWHWPLLSFARIIEAEEPSAAIRGWAVVTSVFLAALTYLLLERPLRSRGKGAALGLLLAMLGLAGCGGVIIAGEGLPGRNPVFAERDAMFEWRDKLKRDCSQELSLPPACARTGQAPQVAVLGDSHSVNLYYALAHHYGESGIDVLRLGRGGCPPLLGIGVRRQGAPEQCREAFTQHLEFVIRSDSIETVFLIAMPRYLERGGLYSLDAEEGKSDKRTVFETGLRRTIDRLQSTGRKVVVVYDWPSVSFDPRSCVQLRPFRLSGQTRQDCVVPRDDFLREHARYRRLLREIVETTPRVAYWDASEAFCDEQVCWAKRDGIMFYRDRHHLSLAGARFLGEHVRIVDVAPDTRPE